MEIVKGMDHVWSQLLTPGMLILTDGDVLEVVEVEIAEESNGGEIWGHVDATLASIDGTTFDTTYPLDHLVPTIPRTFSQAA